MKVHELLTDEDKWWKHNMAVDSVGLPCPVNSPAACRFCLLGAIQRCYPTEEVAEILLKIDLFIRTKFGHHSGNVTSNVTYWNDNGYTTFEQVRDTCLELDV